MVVAGDPSISTVCFESCDPCSVGFLDEAISSLSVVPNPFNSEVEIASELLMKRISVLDMSGKEVFRSTPENNKLKINLNNLKSGVYTLVVESDEMISTHRIIKR